MAQTARITLRLIALAFLIAGQRVLGAAVKDNPPSTAPVSPEQFVVRELGPVGNIARQDAERDPADSHWFLNLPAVERDRMISELNAWSLRVEDVVEPKSVAADGSVKAWRFASKRNPVCEIVDNRAGADMGQMKVRPLISLIKHRPADFSDEKQFILEIDWTPAKGHEVRIRWWLKGTAIHINFDGVLSSNPKEQLPAPTTRPAGAHDGK